MNPNEIIEFIKNASVEELEKFIRDRIEYLNETEVQRRSQDKNNSGYKMGQEIKPVAQTICAYRTFISEDCHAILANNGQFSPQGYYFDATEEIVAMLAVQIKKQQPETIEELCEVVSKVVFDYFGGRQTKGTIKDRLSHIKNDCIYDSEGYEERDKISAFKGTTHAWCVERACVMHQLFKFLGIESQIVMAPIMKEGGELDYHAYNMIRGVNQTIVLDSTMIDFSKPEDGYTSIVQYLPYESFDTFEGFEERKFVGINDNERTCVYNAGVDAIMVVEKENNSENPPKIRSLKKPEKIGSNIRCL